MPRTTISYNGSVIEESSNSTPLEIEYDGQTLATLNENEDIEIKCKNRELLDDIKIGVTTLKTTALRMLSNLHIAVGGYLRLSIPQIKTNSYGYTGETIAPPVKHYDNAKMVRSGNYQATQVGTYTMSFDLIDTKTYKWLDESQETKTITWSITKQSVSIPALSGSYVYTGSAQSVTISDAYDSNVMTMSGTTSATNAGTYSVTFSLKDSTNMQWSDSTIADKTFTWSIAKKQITKPSLSGTYTYNGNSQSVTMSNFDSAYMNKTGDLSKTNVGNYSVTFSLKDSANTEWSDGTTADLTSQWSIGKLNISVPSLSGSYTYNKGTQYVTINNFDETHSTKTGDLSAINAGTYNVTFALVDTTNTKWADNSISNKSLSWTIAVRSITIPSISGTYTFNTASQTVIINDFDSNYSTKTGDLSATNAGSYNITFALSDTTNTKWADNTTVSKTISWTIAKNSLHIPYLTGSYTYDGSEQSVSMSGYSSTYMTRSGTIKATNAGTYTVSFTLIYPNDTIWEDNSNTTQSDSWTIDKKSYTVPSLSTTSYTFDTGTKTPTVNAYYSDYMTQTGTASASSAGSYTITIALKDTDNNQWSNGTTAAKTLSWSIAKRSLTIPSTSSAFTFNASSQTASVSNYNSTYETQSGTTSATSNGTYTITYALKYPSDTTWSDSTTTNKSITWTIAKRSLTIPSVSGSFTYNGSSKSATVSNFDSTYETQGGTASATNAGTYNVTFSLRYTSDTYWSDNTTETKTKSWTISPMSVAVPSLSGGTYTGSSITVSDSSSGKSYYTLSGNTSGTNVGSYSVTATLKDTANTVWSTGGTSAWTGSWSITKKSLTIPTKSSTPTYSGSALTATNYMSNYNSTYMTPGGDTSATNAGSYTVTFSLKDTANTQWSDGTTSSKSVSWSISKATGYITLSSTSTQSIAKGSTGTNTVSSYHGGTISASSSNTSYATVEVSGTTITVTNCNTTSSAKTVTITVSCAATTNYNSASTSYSVSVAKGSCVAGDTLILMGDGTEKQLRDIQVGEMVMTWNLTTGVYEPQPAAVVYDETNIIANCAIHMNFSNGRTVRVVSEHGFFDYTLNKYVYVLEENYEEFIGHEFVTYKAGGGYDLATLDSVEVVHDVPVEMWSLQSAFNENFITEGVLSMTQEYKPGRYEYFDFGDKVRWDLDKMQQDIETYGVFTYEEWQDFVEEDAFYAFNGPWFKILIGKGILNLEDIPDMIDVTPSLVPEDEEPKEE